MRKALILATVAVILAGCAVEPQIKKTNCWTGPQTHDVSANAAMNRPVDL